MNTQRANIKTTPNISKIPLIEYYKQLPKRIKPKRTTRYPRRSLLEAISERTYKAVPTIRRWVSGEIEPALLEKKIIAKLLQSDIEILFPNQS